MSGAMPQATRLVKNSLIAIEQTDVDVDDPETAAEEDVLAAAAADDARPSGDADAAGAGTCLAACAGIAARSLRVRRNGPGCAGGRPRSWIPCGGVCAAGTLTRRALACLDLAVLVPMGSCACRRRGAVADGHGRRPASCGRRRAQLRAGEAVDGGGSAAGAERH